MERTGIRNSPSIRDASFMPPFVYDKEGALFGGLFRDGRVPTLAAQAEKPFLDARELANATPADVIARLARSPNASRFRELFGADALERPEAAFREFSEAFKVPTLRNFSRTAPYFHNGAIATLRDVVEFYETRDTAPDDWYMSEDGKPHKFDDLPAGLESAVNTSEVPYDRRAGEEPALTPAEIDDVVASLRALDDGYN